MRRFRVTGFKRGACRSRRRRADARHRRPGPAHDAGAAGLGGDPRRLAGRGRVLGHLPRPLRQRDRQARRQAERVRAARRDAGPPHQGGARDRGPALLRAFRHRRDRHAPRARRERARQLRGPGRLVALPAARQEPVPVERAHASSARSRKPSSRSGSRPTSPRTRSSSSISTAPTWAAAISASKRRRSSTSASR